jgi:hypothetical protein
MVHYRFVSPSTFERTHVSICPVTIISDNQLTLDPAHVTCADCAIRLIAELHRQQAVLLKTIAGLIVAAQVKKS